MNTSPDLLNLLNELKGFGAYGAVLVTLILTLRSFIGKMTDFLINRDKRASEIHEKTIEALAVHTQSMRASTVEVIEQVKATGHEVKRHIDLRSGYSTPYQRPLAQSQEASPVRPTPGAGAEGQERRQSPMASNFNYSFTQ